MSSRAQHYREAERLLEVLPPTSAVDTLAMKARVLTLEEVQVHAMLATVHDDAVWAARRSPSGPLRSWAWSWCTA